MYDRIAETFYKDKTIHVSTVELMKCDGGQYETMIFGITITQSNDYYNGIGEYQRRYSTEEEAKLGHEIACLLVEKELMK